MTLTPQFLDELRARTLLSALVGRTVKLQRAGREHRACCPFHNEKTPSFYVNDDKGFYHCFGCGAHGDAIRWLTDQRGLSFIDAVKELAQTAGLEMPAPDPRAAERAQRQASLHDVMAAASRWFQAELNGLAGGGARDYLRRRGITAEQAAAFGLGFAPDSRTGVRRALEGSHGLERLIEAGLLIQLDDKEPYDRFRGRLMIPIRDQRGRVIAFGGRIIGEGEPKYLNSPETPLFDKGRTLFNLDLAAGPARKAGRIIVVEGYLDVIALAGAGLEEAVAPLGTALTEGQLDRLWRISEAPILCFDGDTAGQRAALRAAHRALPMIAPDRTLRFATLPAGQDPDDLVRASGAAAMEAVLAQAQPLVDRLWEGAMAEAPLDTPEARAGLRRRLMTLTDGIAAADVRAHYAGEFRARLDSLFRGPAAPNRVQAPMRHGRDGWRPASPLARAIGSGGIDRMMTRAVLAGLLRHPEWIVEQAEAIGRLEVDEPALDRLRGVLLDAAFSGEVLETGRLRAILATGGLDSLADELARSNGLAFSFLRSNSDDERARRDLASAITALAARPGLRTALMTATERLKLSADAALFAEQQRLRAACDEADLTLAMLARGEDGQ